MPWQMFDAAGRELVGTHAAGSNTEVQYNNNGVLAGKSTFTFDQTTDHLATGGTTFTSPDENNYLAQFQNALDAVGPVTVFMDNDGTWHLFSPDFGANLKIEPNNDWTLQGDHLNFTPTTYAQVTRTIAPTAAGAASSEDTLISQLFVTPADDFPQAQTPQFHATKSTVIWDGTHNLSSVVAHNVNVASANTGTTQEGYALNGSVQNTSSGTITNAYGCATLVDNSGTGTLTTAYGYRSLFQNAGGGTITNGMAFYANDMHNIATQPYYFWADSNGVYRIREDNVADTSSFPQAVTALYNPRFTKYTPGATNFERIVQQWKSNVSYLGNEAGGTGTLRNLALMGAAVSTEDGAGNLVLLSTGGLVSSGSMVSITGATTATISRTHIVTGTTADYTITLPAASGNGGKYLSFVFGPTLTELSKFVTLDGNGTEKIDGALTRVCWAGESCTLLCDGSNWFKVGGKTIPMQCNMSKSTGQSCSSSTDTKVLLDTSDFDNTGSMADTTNHKIVCRRTGRYSVNGMGYWNPTALASLFQHNVRINNVGTGMTLLTNVATAGWFAGGTATSLDEAVTTGQDIELYADQFTVGTETFNSPKLQAVELIGW